jgi:hypothetical protein
MGAAVQQLLQLVACKATRIISGAGAISALMAAVAATTAATAALLVAL